MSTRPIADYALLSDCHSAALVSREGSIDWLCWPRFDSPAVFGRLLDEEAGHWRIRPAAPASATRRYVEGALVLETRWVADGGEALLTDALTVGPNERGHELGAQAPHALLRQLRGLAGEVEFVLEFAPRPEYGLVLPQLTLEREGAVLARGGGSVLLLYLPAGVEPALEGATARARFTLREGDVLHFALQHHTPDADPPAHWDVEEIAGLLAETIRAWRSWSGVHQSYDGPWRELVHHSGRVLQGLTYFPTGALVAAPTTSLPEVVGGKLNWDYRYCWVRDASFTLEALWVAACPDEARKFFSFLADAAASHLRRGGHLQVVFGVGGEHDLTERELPHLRGWRGSRPVRIGNDAWQQRQLDVYGELLAAACRLRDQLSDAPDAMREFLRDAADAAAERWREKDQGIWEVRGEPRHFLHSKLMCWVALDRALRLTELLRAGDRVEHWTQQREAVREAILEQGWSESAGAFTQTFGDDTLDASSLVIPLVGFLPATDPRVRSTIDAVAERLTDSRGLVFRYRASPEPEGEEGAFLICTFWLAEALARAGELARARQTFEAALRHANDVGLLSEEVDSSTGELIGNHPQAFSHIGLVNAAWAISQEEGGRLPGSA